MCQNQRIIVKITQTLWCPDEQAFVAWYVDPCTQSLVASLKNPKPKHITRWRCGSNSYWTELNMW